MMNETPRLQMTDFETPSGVLPKIEVVIRPSSHRIRSEHTPLFPLSGGGYTPLPNSRDGSLVIRRIPAYTPDHTPGNTMCNNDKFITNHNSMIIQSL
jgi:hypothetical protein